MVTGSTSLNTQYFQAVWEYGDTDPAPVSYRLLPRQSMTTVSGRFSTSSRRTASAPRSS